MCSDQSKLSSEICKTGRHTSTEANTSDSATKKTEDETYKEETSSGNITKFETSEKNGSTETQSESSHTIDDGSYNLNMQCDTLSA